MTNKEKSLLSLEKELRKIYKIKDDSIRNKALRDWRMKPYVDMDNEILSNRDSSNVTENDILKYTELFLESVNCIHKDLKFNDYFFNHGFIYMVFDYNSPDKLEHQEVIDILGEISTGSCYYIGYKNKLLLKDMNKLKNVLPSQAFKDASKICTELMKMGY